MMNKKIRMFITALLVAALSVLCIGLGGCGNQGQAEDDNANVNATEATVSQLDETDDQGEDDNADQPLATVFFASDYQIASGFGTPHDNLEGILESAIGDAKAIEQVVICGDYTNDAVLHDYQLSPEDSIAQIKELCLDEGIEDTLFVQGNHDKLTESIAETGLHEYDDYLVYVLNTQNDYPWSQGKTKGALDKVKKSAKAMQACFDELIDKGETRPVFVAGHVPLHYTARTSSRHSTGDNLYSSLIFDVVNEAAQNLDIVYFVGHNHSKGWDCYLGGSSIFKKQGDTILIPEFTKTSVNTDKFRECELNFTYMNAGYLGYFMNCSPAEDPDDYLAADNTLTGTVCEIYGNKLVLTRYDADGIHQICSDGEADPYKNYIDKGLISPDHYSSETAGPQEILRKN